MHGYSSTVARFAFRAFTHLGLLMEARFAILDLASRLFAALRLTGYLVHSCQLCTYLRTHLPTCLQVGTPPPRLASPLELLPEDISTHRGDCVYAPRTYRPRDGEDAFRDLGPAHERHRAPCMPLSGHVADHAIFNPAPTTSHRVLPIQSGKCYHHTYKPATYVPYNDLRKQWHSAIDPT